jgi:hypothetical protein
MNELSLKSIETRTLDFVMTRQVYYHCATSAEHLCALKTLNVITKRLNVIAFYKSDVTEGKCRAVLMSWRQN